MVGSFRSVFATAFSAKSTALAPSRAFGSSQVAKNHARLFKLRAEPLSAALRYHVSGLYLPGGGGSRLPPLRRFYLRPRRGVPQAESGSHQRYDIVRA